MAWYLSVRSHTLLFALFLGFGFGVALPVAAQEHGALVDWKVEALDGGEAAVALSRLYTTMYNSGQITTREVAVEKGDTPADIMRREGSWPTYLGPANRLLDAVVCDLNPTFCLRERTLASGSMKDDISLNVDGTVPTDGDWRGLQPGAMLLIPDYSVERSYETIATSAGYLAKRYGDRARTERTGALAALYCNQQPAACVDQPVLTWEGDNNPPVLQFDPRLFDPAIDGATLPEDVMAAFLNTNTRSVLIAVPYLSLRQNLTLPRIGTSDQIGTKEIQRRLDGNMLVVPDLRTESTEVLTGYNGSFLELMQPWPIAPSATEVPSDRIVTIYHFDKAAKLQHCMFKNLIGVQLFEWMDAKAGKAAGPEKVIQAIEASECSPVSGVASRANDHGTHTLGLLIGQLEAFAKALPPDITYFRVVHVPLGASEFESGTAPEASSRIVPVLELLNPPNQPDVVSMSLSWPAVGMEKLNNLVLLKEDLITFVVPAPRQEGPDECARGPAGIKWPGGLFVENVVSVVGLALSGTDDQPDIVTVADAGTGSKCHEIGAFGTLFGPIGETNAVAEMEGASQATPIVAATVAELIRRLPSHNPRPNKIGEHLIASAWFDPDMINVAKATLLDSSNALLTVDADLIVTNSGCRVFGNYVQIRDSAGSNAEFFYKGETGTRRVPSKNMLLSFRNLDSDRVLVVSLINEIVRVEVGERQSGMNNRTIQFSPTQLSQQDCDGISLGNDTIPVSVVDQLIVSKLGG